MLSAACRSKRPTSTCHNQRYSHSSGWQPACAAAKRYIDENYNEAISLDKLAEIAHVNKYYLSHSFKKEYGSSPIDYMLKRRITEAKALLSSTDYSLIQIAEQLGFGSPAYFSKCFRKVEGISPSGYRCALQQKAAKRSE